MKKLIRLMCLGGALLGALYSPAAKAGGQTCSLSANNNAQSGVTQSWVVTAPSATTIDGAMVVTGTMGSGDLTVAINNSYPAVYEISLAAYLPGNSGSLISGSASAPAGAYYVVECFGGPQGKVSASMTTTFTW
jgi:hypothetical protein